MTVQPIVALDVPSSDAALRLVQQLGDACRFYKIGSELFTREGPAIVRAVRDTGADVFLDLKFHDIPNTVRNAAAAASALGVRLMTVHASGGQEMLERAVEGAGDAGVLAVTVLTSLDAATLARSSGREDADVRDEVLRLADLAKSAGAHGIVCSGQEASAVRARHGDALRLLIPGIRLEGGATNDQARVVTPRQAAVEGASYIILGRTVTAATDPVEAMQRVREELR